MLFRSLFQKTQATEGFELQVNLQAQTVSTLDGGFTRSFEVEPFRKHCLIHGLDDIGLTLQHADKIKAFEAKRLADMPWLGTDLHRVMDRP